MVGMRVVSRDKFGRGAVSPLGTPTTWGGERSVTDIGVPAMRDPGLPPAQGLYDPAHEHDACGVGFVVDIKGRKSHAIVSHALTVLKNLLHRGACG